MGAGGARRGLYALGRKRIRDSHGAWAQGRGHPLACLSNDVSEWSAKRRRRFGLERFVSTWVISGDVQVRKPEPCIYQALVDRLGRPAEALVFVDDRLRNLDAARRLGLRTVWLSPTGDGRGHRRVGTLGELGTLLAPGAG